MLSKDRKTSTESTSRRALAPTILGLCLGLVIGLVWWSFVSRGAAGSAAGSAVAGESQASVSSAVGADTDLLQCEQLMGEDATGVVTAERDKLTTVAEWQEQRHAPDVTVVSRLRSLADRFPSDADVTVCVYAGQFPAPGGPPVEDGTSRPPYDRMTLLVLPDGSTLFDSASRSTPARPDTPQRWLLRRS